MGLEKRVRLKAQKVKLTLLEGNRRGTKKARTRTSRMKEMGTKGRNQEKVEEGRLHGPRATPP